MKDFQAEPLTQAFCGRLWGDANHLLSPSGANFPKWTGPRAFLATLFQVNTPSSLKLCFSFMCILLHVEEQYGSRKKGFGPNNAVWLERLPCADLA